MINKQIMNYPFLGINRVPLGLWESIESPLEPVGPQDVRNINNRIRLLVDWRPFNNKTLQQIQENISFVNLGTQNQQQ